MFRKYLVTVHWLSDGDCGIKLSATETLQLHDSFNFGNIVDTATWAIISELEKDQEKRGRILKSIFKVECEVIE